MEVTGPGPIQRSFPIQRPQAVTNKPTQQASSLPQSPQDEVEISPLAQKLQSLAQTGELRAARLAQIKAAIEAGEYETPDKLEAAVDRLLDELLSEES